MEFKKLKNRIVESCKNNSACQDEFKRVLNSKNKSQLLTVLKDNFAWSYPRGILNTKIFDAFGEKLCASKGIYYKNEILSIKNQNAIILCGDVIVKMLGNSTVTEMWGNSTVRTWHEITPETKGTSFCIIDYSRKKIIAGKDFELVVID